MYEKNGALWLKSTDYGDDKDRVVIRDNGVPTYLAADIAYHRNKYDRGFKEMIDIWGADHHGYVCRVKAAMAAFGYDPDKLTVLLLQMVALFRDGQLVKLSKRSGDSVTLDELIEEVGVDEVVQSAEHRAPHRIARYLFDLASMFHSFYRQGRIIGVDPSLQQARLGLITAIALVLRQGLGILGISAPEKM